MYGLNTGGPGVITVGWIVVGFFSEHVRIQLPSRGIAHILQAMFVATSMAEILSALPTSGGPYFWAYMLSPQQHAPLFSWITGW